MQAHRALPGEILRVVAERARRTQCRDRHALSAPRAHRTCDWRAEEGRAVIARGTSGAICQKLGTRLDKERTRGASQRQQRRYGAVSTLGANQARADRSGASQRIRAVWAINRGHSQTGTKRARGASDASGRRGGIQGERIRPRRTVDGDLPATQTVGTIETRGAVRLG